MEGSDKIKSMHASWQHDKPLGDCMIELYKNNLWTDVKFRCSNHDEHERIHAHKIVLAARSPVFQAMFFGPCAEANEEIVLDKVEAETFDLFLRFIYQDKVTLTENIGASVMEIAHFYQVTNLVLYCADFLVSCITSQNVCDILSLARFYKVISLCKACCNFIDKNAIEVMASEGFLKLTVDTITYILKGDTFYADEVEIFTKAEEWAQRKLEESNLDHNGQNIRGLLRASFFHLRLPTMTLDNLMECTRRKGYFSVEEYEDFADFINRKPSSTVTSNSCIKRLPREERMDCSDMQERDVLIDKIGTGFQLSVNKDVKVKTVELAEIYAYLKFNSKFYSGNDVKRIENYERNTESFLQTHENEVIRPCSFLGKKIYGTAINKFGFYTVKEQYGQDLPHDLDVVLYGNLKVICYKNKKGVATGTNDEHKNAESKIEVILHGDGSTDDEVVNADSDNGDNEEEEQENLVYEQDLKFIPTEEAQHVINLTKPLIIEASKSPYTFKVNLEYRNTSLIKMKTVKSSAQRFTSDHGVVAVKNVFGNFTGIRGISFENVSNRD